MRISTNTTPEGTNMEITQTSNMGPNNNMGLNKYMVLNKYTVIVDMVAAMVVVVVVKPSLRITHMLWTTVTVTDIGPSLTR